MQYRKTAELRDMFIKFWESKGSKHLESFSLVPEDPSLLFTIAGMVPLKPYYLGIKEPEYPRVVTCQKCVRTYSQGHITAIRVLCRQVNLLH
ncbi:MAG: hypothetical protein IJQ77_08155 [Synergistaceae bacterium]|nr:hypothetical protein [Synergistaceae bacterium]